MQEGRAQPEGLRFSAAPVTRERKYSSDAYCTCLDYLYSTTRVASRRPRHLSWPLAQGEIDDDDDRDAVATDDFARGHRARARRCRCTRFRATVRGRAHP